MNQVSSLEGFAAQLRQEALAMLGENEFNARALDLFSLQFAHNAVYRKFCESRGISNGSLEHWSGIPAVPTSAFKELELTSIPEDQRSAVFFSSGTSGQRPSRHFHNATSLGIYEASLLSWFEPHLLVSGPPEPVPAAPAALHGLGPKRFAGGILALTPGADQAPHSSLVHMFDTLRRGLRCNAFLFAGRTEQDGAWMLDCGKAMGFLEKAVEEEEPVMLLGAAFSYVHLLDQMAAHGLELELPSGSRALETGGYKGRSRALAKAELHEYITCRLGIAAARIVCEYGMSELSSQAYDRVAPPLEGFRYDNHDQRSAARAFHFPPGPGFKLFHLRPGARFR